MIACLECALAVDIVNVWVIAFQEADVLLGNQNPTLIGFGDLNSCLFGSTGQKNFPLATLNDGGGSRSG